MYRCKTHFILDHRFEETLTFKLYSDEFFVVSCASNGQCQAVTFDETRCHLFYTKLPDGESPSSSCDICWYGECALNVTGKVVH